jgi:hypothetical protein
MAERNKYFCYTAAASAFGGVRTAPVPMTIPTQAMASLSASGGYGSATVDNFGIDGLLTVRKGISTVQGDSKQTELAVTLEGVNIMNVLTLDRLVLHLVSQAPLGSTEASITPAGSLLEGLRIHGKEIEISSSVGIFDASPTYSALEQAYLDGKLAGLILAPGTLGAPCEAGTLQGCQTRVGDVKATLYSQPSGGRLRVKDFGTLYFGEYRISPFSRRLTMLRVELGCDTEGSLSLGDGTGNGHWDPPI